jgi:MATE family multidrug resistance protein
VQTIANGALRGINDTRVPMLLALVGFWAIGFTASYVLAFPAGLGPVGVWIGLALGLAVYALMLVFRFARLTRRPFNRAARIVDLAHGEEAR